VVNFTYRLWLHDLLLDVPVSFPYDSEESFPLLEGYERASPSSLQQLAASSPYDSGESCSSLEGCGYDYAALLLPVLAASE
jgi:hypothetical protein